MSPVIMQLLFSSCVIHVTGVPVLLVTADTSLSSCPYKNRTTGSIYLHNYLNQDSVFSLCYKILHGMLRLVHNLISILLHSTESTVINHQLSVFLWFIHTQVLNSLRHCSSLPQGAYLHCPEPDEGVLVN